MKGRTTHGCLLAVRYLSPEWGEQALEILENDETVRNAMRGVSIRLLTIIVNGPPETFQFIYADVQEGELVAYRVGANYEEVTKGLPKPDFTVSGEYDVFAACQDGDLSERRAILTGKLHLTGSVFKALRHLPALEALTMAMRHVECVTGR